MRIDPKKYFEAASDKNFSVYQVTYSSENSLSVDVVNGEVENQNIGESSTISGRAILNGKVGSFGTDAVDKNAPKLLADSIYQSALYGKEETIDNFFDGKAKYKKAKTCLKEYVKPTLTQQRELALELYREIKKQDERVTYVEVQVDSGEVASLKANTLGLNCKEQEKLLSASMSVVAEDEDKESRSGFKSVFSFKNLEDLKNKAIAVIPDVVHSAVDFFKSKPVESKDYKVVFSPEVVASLLSFYISQLSAKSVMQHLSIFEDKLGEKVTSSLLTIKHTPHITALGAGSYDAEGYPTQDFTVIDKGILKTYFHSLETARHFKVVPNGCGAGNGQASPSVLTIKPGRYSKEDLFKKAKNGLYINDVSGLNSGIDGTSLQFSLPCQGYVIEDGKLSKATSMIIMAGSLVDLFNNVTAVGSDTREGYSINTPSLLVSKVAVSGK